MTARTYGEVVATMTTCVCLDRDGDACGKTGHPQLPPGVCIDHAITIARSLLRMGGIEVLR